MKLSSLSYWVYGKECKLCTLFTFSKFVAIPHRNASFSSSLINAFSSLCTILDVRRNDERGAYATNNDQITKACKERGCMALQFGNVSLLGVNHLGKDWGGALLRSKGPTDPSYIKMVDNVGEHIREKKPKILLLEGYRSTMTTEEIISQIERRMDKLDEHDIYGNTFEHGEDYLAYRYIKDFPETKVCGIEPENIDLLTKLKGAGFSCKEAAGLYFLREKSVRATLCSEDPKIRPGLIQEFQTQFGVKIDQQFLLETAEAFLAGYRQQRAELSSVLVSTLLSDDKFCESTFQSMLVQPGFKETPCFVRQAELFAHNCFFRNETMFSQIVLKSQNPDDSVLLMVGYSHLAVLKNLEK